MSQHILVIEDQEDNRQILRNLLTSADFEVIEAEDGEAGLTAAAAHRPDLILKDIHLPGLDGDEATRKLKANGCCRLSLSLSSPHMPWAEMLRRPKRRVATPTFSSPLARVSYSPKSVSICCGRADRGIE
jgi:CheY-like chemotaxis protein